MRIKSLYIKKYKILEEFTINFDQDINTHVIIGKNGSGKTTLFEAIIRIFREISLASSKSALKLQYNNVELEFRISYNCKGVDVDFGALNVNGNHEMYFKVDGVDFQLNNDNLRIPDEENEDFTKKPIFKYLPDHNSSLNNNVKY